MDPGDYIHDISDYHKLRDQFACAALTGLLAGADYEYPADGIAKQAFQMADAMMKARSLKKETQP